MLCMAHPIRVLHVIGMFNCMSTIAWSTARSPPRIPVPERDRPVSLSLAPVSVPPRSRLRPPSPRPRNLSSAVAPPAPLRAARARPRHRRAPPGSWALGIRAAPAASKLQASNRAPLQRFRYATKRHFAIVVALV